MYIQLVLKNIAKHSYLRIEKENLNHNDLITLAFKANLRQQ
jgi:DNA-binding XRE family transcriptional regulator